MTHRFAGMAGKYFQRHGNDESEDRARDDIGRLLEGWKKSMWGRDGVMARNDGSALREDELRVSSLRRAERSAATQEDALNYISPGMRADYAIGMYHNLMYGLDAMLLNDARTDLRLHLGAPYVHIRALIEAATTALWILGPASSDARILNTLRLRHDELNFSRRLADGYSKHAGVNDKDAQDAAKEQGKFVDGQLADLETITRKAGLPYKSVQISASPGYVAAEGGMFAPKVGKALAFWYWSTASSIAHGEPNNINMLADMKFIGVDHRDQPVADVEPSAVSVWNHLSVANELITRAHALWNIRAKA